ncbi:MAG: hypothetical protein WC314_26935 [Vulcanimicrobiota bacterium]
MTTALSGSFGAATIPAEPPRIPAVSWVVSVATAPEGRVPGLRPGLHFVTFGSTAFTAFGRAEALKV